MIGAINAILALVMIVFCVLHMFPKFRKNRVVPNILVGVFLVNSILYFIEGKWGWGLGDAALAGLFLLIGYMNKQTTKMNTTLEDIREMTDIMEEHHMRIREILDGMNMGRTPDRPKKKIKPPKNIKKFDFKNKDYEE
jgi:hypothetical protein